MANVGFKNIIFSKYPCLEIFSRFIFFNKFIVKAISIIPNKKRKIFNKQQIDFDKVLHYLKENGVKKGSILILHSSYENLILTKKKPIEIIDKLLELLGDEGTLAMPANRKLKGEFKSFDLINKTYDDIILEYDLNKSKVWSGALPMFMLRDKRSEISKFPINSMVAIGKDAKRMMEKNISGNLPTACGENSSWKYCLDKDATVISLGVDLVDSLTMIHAAEDIKNENWPIKGWYRHRTFRIKEKDDIVLKTVKERHPKWGMLYFMKRRLCKDLIENKILKTKLIDGLLIEIVSSKELINFLDSKNSNGYPYLSQKKK